MKRMLYMLAAFLWALPSPAMELRISGDRISVRAERAPLMRFLEAVADQGVRVRADPGLSGEVSLRVESAPVDQVLEQVLKAYGFVLEWGVLDGPLGSVASLRELTVFRPGREREAREIGGPRPRMALAKDELSGWEFAAGEIVVGFRPGAAWKDVQALLDRVGGRLVESIPVLGVYRIRLDRNADVMAVAALLAESPIVARAEPNWIYRAGAPVRGDGTEPPLARNLPPARPGDRAIAVLDSGLERSAADPALLGSYDAFAPGRPLEDSSGHGTQMALIATGAVSPRGTAWDSAEPSPLLAVRVFDDQGLISNYSLMRALDYARSRGARVVNMSWGSSARNGFIEQLIGEGVKAGMVFVAAAGNEPTERPTYPAAYAGVVAVGALDARGEPWEQSNRGTFVAVWAPGSASMPVGYGGPPGAYVGTSIASAYVARIIGEFYRKNPEADPALLAKRLEAAASRRIANGGVVLDDAAIQKLIH